MPAPIPDLSSDQTCHYYQAPSGQRCGSPALRGEYYCYHHHIKHANRNNRRVLIDPEVTCMEIPPIENRASIFIALAAVVHRLAENTIDTRRAGQMIYGLQVAMRALEPPPSLRARTTPTAEVPPAPSSESDSDSDSDSDSESNSNSNSNSEARYTAELAPANSAPQPATDNQQPATSPRTIPITRESLLYFLRSRHCASCNAELFPADQLTERRNAGAPPEVIEEARPALPAPQPATDNPQPAVVLPSLQAVAEEPTTYGPLPLFAILLDNSEGRAWPDRTSSARKFRIVSRGQEPCVAACQVGRIFGTAVLESCGHKPHKLLASRGGWPS